MKIFTGTSYFTVILIAILWVIPVTSAQAKLTENQCQDKLNAFGKSLQVFKNGYYEVVNSLENRYRGEAFSLNLYSGECSHFEYSKQLVIARKDDLKKTIKYCIEDGLGPTCGQPAVNIEYPASTPATDSRSQQSDSSSQQTESNNDYPSTKKLSAAEQKRQQKQQKADDLGTQSQQLAQENQSKADAARQGKRKTHDPNYQASQCIQPDYSGLYGAMVNKCDFKVWYKYCGHRPNEKSWLKSIACENQQFGMGEIKPLKRDAAHTKHVEGIYWLACKDPGLPTDVEFVDGQGVKGRCEKRY